MSQGDRPAVDFSRHDLYTCGRTCPVQHIVPVCGGGGGDCQTRTGMREEGREGRRNEPRTNSAQDIFSSIVNWHPHLVLTLVRWCPWAVGVGPGVGWRNAHGLKYKGPGNETAAQRLNETIC